MTTWHILYCVWSLWLFAWFRASLVDAGVPSAVWQAGRGGGKTFESVGGCDRNFVLCRTASSLPGTFNTAPAKNGAVPSRYNRA